MAGKSTYIDDEYRIRRPLSNDGNMATVYLCTDDEDKECAIKLFDKFPGDEDSQHLQETVFYREVETLQRVSHPNIVKYLSSGEDDRLEKFYIALEYINGKNLKEALPLVATYDEYEKIELIDQILAGVEFLHKKNVIHRDLKPSNIMLNDDGVIKIIDFGVSKYADTYYSDRTVIQCKTPQYCSPEQEAKKTVTAKSDIYSLGLILYEIFTGNKVDKNNVFNTDYLSESVKEIISKMLKREPAHRYDAIADIRKEFAILKKEINQDKFIIIGITKSVAQKLFQNDYLKRDDVMSAAIEVNKDLQGRVYIKSSKNPRTGEVVYELLGRQFSYICQRDKFDNERFTIIGIRFQSNADIMATKEISYEIPYRINVKASASKIITVNEITASSLLNDLMDFELDRDEKRTTNINNRAIVKKWEEILKLERRKFEKEKASLAYKSFKQINDDTIEVILSKNVPADEVKFTYDSMLQMSAKGKKNREYNVGYMKDYLDGVLTIGLAADADIENINSYGDVSINKTMVDIALKRQEQALKAVRFKESVNPNIGNLIFEPEKATSSGSILLTMKDCHSKYIDNSKLKSLEKALTADDLFLLQGPPGTGKTTFISEVVCQILDEKPESKILIASQSHVAVDHSLTKIKELMPKIKMIRIGQKEKFAESVSDYTLDRYCKEWTGDVIVRCSRAIEEYKNEIGLDDSLQEKNTYVLEIERLINEISSMEEMKAQITEEKEKLGVLDEKWSFINETISSMKTKVKTRTNHVSDDVLADIVNTFITDLSVMNTRLGDIIEESVALSNQKDELEKRNADLSTRICASKRDANEWKEVLGLSDDSLTFQEYKESLASAMKQNQSKYDKFSKIKNLCSEWRKRVEQGEGLLQESLVDATIVGATCLGIAGLGDKIDLQFDWVIIDEAGKATPTEILVPICLGKKIIMVGDHKQLPPVVDEELLLLESANKDLTRQDLETSLFEYMEQHLNGICKDVLSEQYRMHPTIGQLISEMFYPETPIRSMTKKEDKAIPLELYESKALVWLSTCNQKNRKEEHSGVSFRNSFEAKLIFEQLLFIDKELRDLGLKKEVAIIAGYKEQKNYIRRLYMTQYESKFENVVVEINTVDAFQGREADIVFYSIVRSNEYGNIGFLKDMRRLNVAFSRARELLVVIGDHQCATKRLMLQGNDTNPFVGIVQFIMEHEEECLLKEV